MSKQLVQICAYLDEIMPTPLRSNGFNVNYFVSNLSDVHRHQLKKITFNLVPVASSEGQFLNYFLHLFTII